MQLMAQGQRARLRSLDARHELSRPIGRDYDLPLVDLQRSASGGSLQAGGVPNPSAPFNWAAVEGFLQSGGSAPLQSMSQGAPIVITQSPALPASRSRSYASSRSSGRGRSYPRSRSYRRPSKSSYYRDRAIRRKAYVRGT